MREHAATPPVAHRCHGCLSRRRCLQIISAAAAGIGLTGGIAPVLGQVRRPDPGFVDPAGLRPCPKVSIHSAILEMPRPYWLGWPGTTYDLDARQKEYRGRLAESCKGLKMDLSEEAAPIHDDAGVAALIKAVQARKPDALVLTMQHMNCWGWADRLTRDAGCPVIIFAPIGTSFTGHVAGISRRPGVYLVSSLEWSAVEDGLRIIRAKRQFEETRVLWIHGNKRQETVLERLGTKVRAIPRDTFNQLFDRMPVNEEVEDVASTFRRGAQKVVEPDWQDSLNSARAYTTAKRLMADEKAHAISMDCLGMVEAKLVPTPPCGAWTILQDEGITCGCEADLFGATSMMLTSYLLDRPGYMNDPVAETAKNLLIVSHCTSGTRLDGFTKPKAPYILRDHSESSLGIAVQVLWPKGAPVTLIRFQNPNELIVDTGKVVSNVDTPPAGGCRTSVEVQMDNIEDARDVLGFHQVVTLGDHRRVVEAFCQVMGIRIIHSPRFTSHA